MAKDHIVEEVRRIREEQAAKHAFDIKSILAAAKKRQRRSGRKVVSLARLRKADLDEFLKGRTRESVFDEEPLSAADLKAIRRGLEDIRLGRVLSREAYRRKRTA